MKTREEFPAAQFGPGGGGPGGGKPTGPATLKGPGKFGPLREISLEEALATGGTGDPMPPVPEKAKVELKPRRWPVVTKDMLKKPELVPSSEHNPQVQGLVAGLVHLNTARMWLSGAGRTAGPEMKEQIGKVLAILEQARREWPLEIV